MIKNLFILFGTPKGFLDKILSTTYFKILPLEKETLANLAEDTNKFLFFENFDKLSSIKCLVMPKILEGLTVLSVEIRENFFLSLLFFFGKKSTALVDHIFYLF